MAANSAIPSENIRHNLDPFLVMDQINHEIARNHESFAARKAEAARMNAEYAADVANGNSKKKWAHPPMDPAQYDSHQSSADQRARTVHSTVRVIELPVKGKRFILVYGDADDATVTLAHGVGPFKTFQNAADFFLKGGR